MGSSESTLVNSIDTLCFQNVVLQYWISTGHDNTYLLTYLLTYKVGLLNSCSYVCDRWSSLAFFCCFTSQVNSYGHGGTVSLHIHTFFLGKPEQAVYQYFVHILSLVTDNNPS